MARLQQRRRCIERPQPADEVRQRGGAVGGSVNKIGLGQHQAVGEGHLLDRNIFADERGGAGDGIDRGDDAAERQAAGQSRVGHEGLQNGCRVRKPAGLDDDAREGGDAALIAAPQQVVERRGEVVADFAAQAAGLQFDEAVRAGLDQFVVEADLAEFVDDDGGFRERQGGAAAGPAAWSCRCRGTR